MLNSICSLMIMVSMLSADCASLSSRDLATMTRALQSCQLARKGKNPYRRIVTNISPNGMHYSWDWNGVHFVQLNRVAVNVGEPNQSNAMVGDQCYALDFIQQDLAANVGSSNRPVFIVQHYGFEEFSSGWWTQYERSLFYNAISGYNVIALLMVTSILPISINGMELHSELH